MPRSAVPTEGDGPSRGPDTDRQPSLAHNAGWLAAERMVGMAAAAGISIVLARTLGPARFGDYSAAFNLAYLASDATGLGLATLLGHELLTRPRDDGGLVVATAVRLRAVAGALAFVPLVAVITVLLLPASRDRPAVLLLGLLCVVRSLEVYEHAQQAWEQGRSLALARIATTAVVAIGLAVLVASETTALWAPATLDLARYGLYGVALVPLVRRRTGQSRATTAEARRLLRAGLPLLLPSVAYVVNLRVDQVMLGVMSGSHQVGIYAASARLAESVYFLPVVLATALFPRLVAARADEARPARYVRAVVRGYSLMWALGIGLAVLVAVTAPISIGIAYGGAYSDGTAVLRVLALAIPIVFLRALSTRWMVMESQIRLVAWSTVAAAVVNVVVNLVLIPPLGAMGAAIATVAGTSVGYYAVLFLHPGSRPLAGHVNRGLVQAPRLAVEALRRGGGDRRRP